MQFGDPHFMVAVNGRNDGVMEIENYWHTSDNWRRAQQQLESSRVEMEDEIDAAVYLFVPVITSAPGDPRPTRAPTRLEVMANIAQALEQLGID